MFYYFTHEPGGLAIVSGSLLIIYIIYRISKTVFKLDGYWQHYFDNFTYSTQTFYQDVEAVLNHMQMPNVAISRVKRHETNMLSANREYLRIEREKLVFEICAASFGTGFFISSREGTLPGLRHKALLAIPVIGPYLAHLFFRKTYYQIDSQNMFASAVHHTVLETMAKITDGKSTRILTDSEKLMRPVRA